MSAAVVILTDQFVLQQLLNAFVGIPTDIAKTDAVVFGDVMKFLDEILTALFCERRDGKTNELAIVSRIESQIGAANRLLNHADLGSIPRLDGDQEWLRNVQRGYLIQWCGSTVIIHSDVIE